LEKNHKTKLENCIEDYKQYKSKSFAYLIVIEVLILIVVAALFFSYKHTLVRIITLIAGIVLMVFVVGLMFYFSPRTTITTKEFNGKTMTAYVINHYGKSYLNLHYQDTKYYKEFQRKDYDFVSLDDVPKEVPAGIFDTQLSLAVLNAVGLIGNSFNNKLKLVCLNQEIDNVLITVIYDNNRNKIAIYFPDSNEINK